MQNTEEAPSQSDKSASRYYKGKRKRSTHISKMKKTKESWQIAKGSGETRKLVITISKVEQCMRSAAVFMCAVPTILGLSQFNLTAGLS